MLLEFWIAQALLNGSTENEDGKQIGHVGLAADSQTIIHATNRVGVEEVSLEEFFRQRKFYNVRRIVSMKKSIVTVSIPDDQEVEISNDIEWILFHARKWGRYSHLPHFIKQIKSELKPWL